MKNKHIMHYLDYYSEWKKSLFDAEKLIDLKKVEIRASSFIGILNELLSAGLIAPSLALRYIHEVNAETWRKFATFNN